MKCSFGTWWLGSQRVLGMKKQWLKMLSSCFFLSAFPIRVDKSVVICWRCRLFLSKLGPSVLSMLKPRSTLSTRLESVYCSHLPFMIVKSLLDETYHEKPETVCLKSSHIISDNFMSMYLSSYISYMLLGCSFGILIFSASKFCY